MGMFNLFISGGAPPCKGKYHLEMDDLVTHMIYKWFGYPKYLGLLPPFIDDYSGWWKIPWKWMMTGGSPILGNHQTVKCSCVITMLNCETCGFNHWKLGLGSFNFGGWSVQAKNRGTATKNVTMTKQIWALQMAVNPQISAVIVVG